jgi:3-deoxy-7-phosphoheptulonate synthase
MLKSSLVDGRQDFTDRAGLAIGQSITDACMGWDMTVPVLRELAAAVRAAALDSATETARSQRVQGLECPPS